jgi:tetratricopeptide (TPR) repeat protein
VAGRADRPVPGIHLRRLEDGGVRLIGRQRELAAVQRLLDRASGGWLMVSGPAGSGKTALLDAAADLARERGRSVIRAHGSVIPRVAPNCGSSLLLADDLDRAGPPAAESLARLAAWLMPGTTAVIVSVREPFDLLPTMPRPTEGLRLRALDEADLAELLPDLGADAVHAVWLVSAGLPGAALAAADELASTFDDPAEHLALTRSSRAEFLDLDVGLVRLLDAVAAAPLPSGARARVLARLARELLADPTAADRRRALADEAVRLARDSGDPGTLAEVLDSRLHALWDPGATDEWLSSAAEIVANARRAGDSVLELRGLLWSFTAHAERGDLAAAEATLAMYGRVGALVGHAETAAVVAARQAMLATVRGRFETAIALAGEVAERGRQAGLADTERLVASLHGRIAMLRGEAASEVPVLQKLAQRLPGHFYEAAVARALAESGSEAEAALELERVLPAVLTGSGPRWVGALADLAVVASRTGPPEYARALYDALLPYAGRLVVWGGATTVTGPVDDYLGRLAAQLGLPDQAEFHWNGALAMEQRIGALPWLAETLVARAAAAPTRDGVAADLERARVIAQRLGLGGVLATLTTLRPTHEAEGTPPAAAPSRAREWRLAREGDGWVLDAGAETARLRDRNGIRYLRTLVSAPGQEIPALDLVAGGASLRVPAADPLLDVRARAQYRRRLAALDEELEAADRAGDVDRSAAVQRERDALVIELRRAAGLGGRARTHSTEAERARVNATRALWATVRRIEAAAPLAGLHLRRSLRTGQLFRYQPSPDGPARWKLTSGRWLDDRRDP